MDKKCCLCTTVVVLVIAFTLLFCAIYIPLAHKSYQRRHREPKFEVDSVSTTPLNVSANQISGDWNVTFSVQNRFESKGMSYKSVLVSLFYKDACLSNTTIPPFYQPGNGQEKQTVHFSAKSVRLDKNIEDGIVADLDTTKNKDGIKFRVNVDALVTVDPSSSDYKQMSGWVMARCGGIMVRFSDNTSQGTLEGGSTRCSERIYREDDRF